MPPDLFNQAHARRTDPGTSHEAAAAATLGLERQRSLVLAYAKGRGEQGFMDIQLEDAHPDESDSGLRTRRSELTARNIILDSGRRDRHGDSARRRIIWVHRDFVENAPAEKVAPPSPADTGALKEEARTKAVWLRREADQLLKTWGVGLTLFSRELHATANLLEQLGR